MDISKLEREKTHRLWCELEDGAGSVFILLTVSGMTNVETISDLMTYQEDPEQNDTIRKQFVNRGREGGRKSESKVRDKNACGCG